MYVMKKKTRSQERLLLETRYTISNGPCRRHSCPNPGRVSRVSVYPSITNNRAHTYNIVILRVGTQSPAGHCEHTVNGHDVRTCMYIGIS